MIVDGYSNPHLSQTKLFQPRNAKNVQETDEQ